MLQVNIGDFVYMARRVIIVISAIFIFSFVASGQENIKQKRRFFRLPERATTSDYHQGIINIKVKPDYRNIFENPQQVSPGVSAILEELGFESLRPVIPEINQQKVNARMKKKPQFDIGLYQRLRYTGNVPIEEAINRAYQILTERVDQVEYLIGYEGNAFAFTGNIEDDLLSITAVHPMREEAVRELLVRAGADWPTVHRLIAQGQLVEMEYEGYTFYTRKLDGRRG